MPREETDIDDMTPESSTGELDAAAKSSLDTAATAESSAATDEEGNEILNVVRDVVDERTKTPDTAPSAEGSETGQEPGDPTATKEPDNEDYSDVPFHKHPRFQQLLRDKKANEADAVRYRNVETFLDTSGLTAEDAADILQIAGLAKTKPGEAWEKLKPWVQDVMVRAGIILSEDLQQKVRAGELTAEAAKEISQSRATVKSVEAQRTSEQEREARRQQAETQQAIADVANTWEQDRWTKDPNFEAKQPLVAKEVLWLQRREGVPKTSEEVKAQLQRAYDAVNKSFVAPTPSPVPTRTPQKPALRPVTGGQVAGNARPEINSTLDVIDSVMSTRRRA